MQSYTRGPKGLVVRQTIGDAFLETANRFADRVALISRHQGIRLNWAEYAHEAHRVAAGLRALGLNPGDRAGVWATNCAEWPILQFGCALAGVVLVNVNPANRSHELSFVLRKSRIRALFLHAQGRHSNYKSILEESRAGQTLALEHIIYFDSPQWGEFLRDPDGITVRPDPDQPANIQYTSGTTGQPKGVLLTHVNLVNNARFFAECMRVTEEDRICVPVPMFHCFGCVIGTMTAAVSGATCIFPSATFDPVATLEAIDTERATVIYGVPAMFIAELQHPEFTRFQLTSLRTGIMAGAPCPIEVMRRVIDTMHCRHMLVVYGQTEASPGITSSRVDDDLETRCTTVGGAMPETEVRIVSSEGETLPVGEQGEWVALLNRALFWFHPLAWWLERRLSALAEEACDSTVIEQGHDPRNYSEYLLELARVVQRAGMRVNVTGMAMPGSYLPHRIRKMIAGTAPRVSPARMVGAFIAWATCSAIFAAGTPQHVTRIQIQSTPPVEVTMPAAEPIPAPAGPVGKPAPVLLAQANPASVAQTRGPVEQFEVASVKPSAPVPPSGGVYFGPPRGGPGTPDPGLITWTYARLSDLLMTAYDMKNYQINGPAWLATERYDIVARVPAGATKEQVNVMWQKLLTERFGVVLHHQSREFQVEELVIDKGGSKLKETTWDPASPLPPGPPQQDKDGGLASPGQVARIFPRENGADVHTIGRAQPISKLTDTIGNMLGRPVLDKTGLAGKYDYTIDFSVVPGVAYRPPPPGIGPGPGAASVNASEPGPDIAAAVQQQLGLRLVPSKASIDVLIVDKAERLPTAN